MAEVYLLWEQADEHIDIATRVSDSGYRPALVGVFAHVETPTRMALEYNANHHYSRRWIAPAPIEES